jgi:hypothetical protein
LITHYYKETNLIINVDVEMGKPISSTSNKVKSKELLEEVFDVFKVEILITFNNVYKDRYKSHHYIWWLILEYMET